MAKKNKKSQSSRKTPRLNLKKGLMVAVLFLVMLSFILTSIPKFGGSTVSKPAVSGSASAPAGKPGNSAITFTKQGTLRFKRASNPDPLTIDIEVADTEVKRRQGLMYRRHMNQNQGMLFIMEESKPQSFYMRNTHISLDIIYADDQKRSSPYKKIPPRYLKKVFPLTETHSMW